MPFCEAETGTVTPIEIWPPETKVIEFNPPDAKLAKELQQSGCRRYLAVISSTRRHTQAWPSHFHLARVNGPLPVSSNNADAVVLCGWTALRVWRLRQFRHARYVAIRPAGILTTVLALLGFALQMALGRIAWQGVINLSQQGSKQRIFCFQVKRRKVSNSARHYQPVAAEEQAADFLFPGQAS
jgi:hypothetical protein